MSGKTLEVRDAAILKNKLDERFYKKGIAYGLISGLTFGLYSTVAAIAMTREPLAGAAAALTAPFVCSALNDSLAAIWLLLWNIWKGRVREIGRSLITIPGMMVVLAALFGGPLANGAYLVGIEAAGAAAIPISALCPMFGALFARVFLKQKIEKRVAAGMMICVIGAALISFKSPEGTTSNFTFGILCAFVAAIGWGLEGVFSAFGMSMIDSNIAINIRQGASGLLFLFVVLPMFKGVGLFTQVLGSMSLSALIGFGALFAAVSFLTWYSSNSMAGVATGMSLNITYVLWGVIFAAIFLGEALTLTVAAGAVIITAGAVLVAMNPAELLRKKGGA